DNLFLPLTRAPPASAGLGATARERRGQDPAPRAGPGGSSTGISLQGVSARPSPGRRFAASSPRRSAPGPPARPGAPRAQPPEVRAGGPGEEPEKPTGANQVSEPLLFGTNITRDELFLPDNPLFLTAHPSPDRREEREVPPWSSSSISKRLPLDATSRPPFCRSTDLVITECMNMALLSNILAAYSFVSENPERAALYFVSGVCIGLVLTLAALVMRISCHTDCRQRPRKKFLQDRENSSDSSDSEDGSSDTASDISVRRHRRFERTLNKNVFTSAEELERAQRLEERERIIREIWMNGQPEVPGTRSLNRYY
ncbi:protein eva-1 homolog A, partial [Halichoerus grypus]|uniref:protein eva-1 homolog A n=1 Tax=Halichoerus grypus TaxID=9711 RepID=UPI0016593649